jgi:FkbM family methyltransferase
MGVIKDNLGIVRRILRFSEKSWQEKVNSYLFRWNRWFPGVPAPIHLPSDVWWLVDNDFIGQSLLNGGYENAESSFARHFLEPGMTALDIGAHRGFHALHFSKSVGRRGRILAFEPSPSDVKRLKLHLVINFRRNVEVKDCALGEEAGNADLYIVRVNTVLNSLRPPDTTLEASPIPVVIRKLDDVLSQAKVKKVDFIKLDVEGGELGVLKGAEHMLQQVPRPVILCEILEQRTRPWGYPGHLIIQHLSERGFAWFELNPDAKLLRINTSQSEFNGNFVAVPEESLGTVRHLLCPTNYASAAQASCT